MNKYISIIDIVILLFELRTFYDILKGHVHGLCWDSHKLKSLSKYNDPSNQPLLEIYSPSEIKIHIRIFKEWIIYDKSPLNAAYWVIVLE